MFWEEGRSSMPSFIWLYIYWCTLAHAYIVAYTHTLFLFLIQIQKYLWIHRLIWILTSMLNFTCKLWKICEIYFRVHSAWHFTIIRGCQMFSHLWLLIFQLSPERESRQRVCVHMGMCKLSKKVQTFFLKRPKNLTWNIYRYKSSWCPTSLWSLSLLYDLSGFIPVKNVIMWQWYFVVSTLRFFFLTVINTRKVHEVLKDLKCSNVLKIFECQKISIILFQSYYSF